jgi:hypothetical protein
LKEQPRKDGILPADQKQAEQQLEELLSKWSQTLPESFTLGTVGNGSRGTTGLHYPDLHFKADGRVPGLYYADLDLKVLAPNGNGHKTNGIEFEQEGSDKET